MQCFLGEESIHAKTIEHKSEANLIFELWPQVYLPQTERIEYKCEFYTMGGWGKSPVHFSCHHGMTNSST